MPCWEVQEFSQVLINLPLILRPYCWSFLQKSMMLDNLWQIAANCLIRWRQRVAHVARGRSHNHGPRQWPVGPIMRHLEQLYLSRLRLYHLQFFHSSSSVGCYTYTMQWQHFYTSPSWKLNQDIIKFTLWLPEWKNLMQLWSMLKNLTFYPLTQTSCPIRHSWASLRPSQSPQQ